MEIKDDFIVTVTLSYKVNAYTAEHAIIIVQDILDNAINNNQLLESQYEVI